MICKLHRSGASFRGAVAYCLDEARDREAEREAAPSGARSRVAWTETVNLGHRRRPHRGAGRWRRR